MLRTSKTTALSGQRGYGCSVCGAFVIGHLWMQHVAFHGEQVRTPPKPLTWHRASNEWIWMGEQAEDISR